MWLAMASASDRKGRTRVTSLVGMAFGLALSLCLAPGLMAQDEDDQSPIHAITVGTLHPVSGPAISPAVILVQDGKILKVGARAQVAIPANAVRHDHSDLVATPGFVNAASSAYSGRATLSISGSNDRADRSVSSSLRPTWADALALARGGITTALVHPTGGGLAGRAALVKPVRVPSDEDARKEAPKAEDVLRSADAALVMGFARGTRSKKRFTDSLAAATKYEADLKAFEKAGGNKAEEKKEEKKPAEESKESKEGEKSSEEKNSEEGSKGEEKKEEAKKEEKKGPEEPKKDPKVLTLLAHLEGRMPGVLSIASATDFLHFESILKGEKRLKPAILWWDGRGGAADSWRVGERIAEHGLACFVTASASNAPRTLRRILPARMLMDRGVPVAVVPGRRMGAAGPQFHVELMELVRHGVPAEDVLAAVTLMPARILGIDAEVGSIEPGKAADLLFFSGDPFAPTSRLEKVLVGGATAYEAGDEETL